MSTVEIVEAPTDTSPIHTFPLHQLRTWTDDFQHRIGEGGQAVVYSGKINWPNSSLDGKDIAVKRTQITRRNTDEPKEEARILSSNQHPNIIGVFGICSTPEYFFLMMPLFSPNSEQF